MKSTTNTWIALLRGINVGGHHKLPMKELAAELEALGLSDVKTYIQSGNAVFRSPQTDASALSERIASAIREDHGFEPRVLVLSRSDFRAAVRANPFPAADAEPRTVHLSFLAKPAADPDLEALDALKAKSEDFVLTERVFYLYAPDGIGRSKLAAKVETSLGVPATARNWRTVIKILEIAEGLTT